ncbi:MAG: SDR family NAD(P)-dependent oxidoreductase, partial [Alphaproteobacteria bacterium]|nr:SDR family NAD(P)-dependent oxidoreductase [Alphaproteobacteria bacterium]
MTRLTERSALVTGASRGIGRAVALAFAKEGANVTVSARSTDALDDLVREITEIGGSALAVAADLAQEDEIAPIAEAARERFGSVDILVNNAGIIHPPIDLVDFDAGLWRQV